jgi:hypothetical protein
MFHQRQINHETKLRQSLFSPPPPWKWRVIRRIHPVRIQRQGARKPGRKVNPAGISTPGAAFIDTHQKVMPDCVAILSESLAPLFPDALALEVCRLLTA